MNAKIEKLKKLRLHLLQQIQTLDKAQLNKIPPGFNNNIIWNLGHMIAAQQNICYVKAGLTIIVEDKYFTRFLSNTKPTEFFGSEDIDAIKHLFIASIDRLETDLNANAFVNYSPPAAIEKAYGFRINDIHEALEYLLYHDGLHAGNIHCLIRAVYAPIDC